MEFSYEKLMRIIKANILALIAVGLVCFGTTFAFIELAVSPTYYSTVKFNIVDNSISNQTSTSTLNVKRDMVDSYIAVLETNDFYKMVQSSLPQDMQKKYTAEDIQRGMKLSSVNETEIMSITFGSKDADDAEKIASLIMSCIQPRIANTLGDCSVFLVDSATPAYTTGTRALTFSIAAFLAGALVVLGYLFVREHLDMRVKSAHDLSLRYNIPILGAVPTFKTVAGNAKGEDNNGKK